MPLYRLSSNSSAFLSVEFRGDNAGSAFAAAKRFCFDDAQLWQDGRYISTLRRQGADRDYRSVCCEVPVPEHAGAALGMAA